MIINTNSFKYKSDSYIDIEKLIDKNDIKIFQISVIALSTLILFIEGYDFQAMALAVPTIMRSWNVHDYDFGYVLSLVLIGQGIGSVVFGPLSDKLGRKYLIVVALIIVGLSSLGTTMANNTGELSIWRLITGFGIGGSAVAIWTLVLDYMPSYRRGLSVACLYASFSLGAFVAGFVAPYIVNHGGWKGIFYVGGLIPIITALVLSIWLPESIKFLIINKPESKKLIKLVKKLDLGEIQTEQLVVSRGAHTKSSILTLLQPKYLTQTLLWWGIYVITSFTYYGMASWLPTLLVNIGFNEQSAQRCSGFLWAGTLIGGILISIIFDRLKSKGVVLASGLLTAAVVLALFRYVPSNVVVWSAMLLLVGAGVGGMQLLMHAIAAIIYPSVILATGIGAGGIISRFGSILAPIAGAWALSANVGNTNILAFLTIPVFIIAILVLLIFKVHNLQEES